ncbi:MAG: peptide-methionine (S)-S-oxide reductase [Nitrospira sp.]
MIKEIHRRKAQHDAPIVTQVAPASRWYEAESYHQEYFARNPLQGCARSSSARRSRSSENNLSHD